MFWQSLWSYFELAVITLPRPEDKMIARTSHVGTAEMPSSTTCLPVNIWHVSAHGWNNHSSAADMAAR